MRVHACQNIDSTDHSSVHPMESRSSEWDQLHAYQQQPTQQTCARRPLELSAGMDRAAALTFFFFCSPSAAPGVAPFASSAAPSDSRSRFCTTRLKRQTLIAGIAPLSTCAHTSRCSLRAAMLMNMSVHVCIIVQLQCTGGKGELSATNSPFFSSSFRCPLPLPLLCRWPPLQSARPSQPVIVRDQERKEWTH